MSYIILFLHRVAQVFKHRSKKYLSVVPLPSVFQHFCAKSKDFAFDYNEKISLQRLLREKCAVHCLSNANFFAHMICGASMHQPYIFLLFSFVFCSLTVNAIITACKQGSSCLYIKIPSFISVSTQYKLYCFVVQSSTSLCLL